MNLTLERSLALEALRSNRAVRLVLFAGGFLAAGLSPTATHSAHGQEEEKTPTGYIGAHAKSNRNVLDARNAFDGVTVTRVVENSPADSAGLEVGDVILQVNGEELVDPARLRSLAATLPVGSTIRFRVERDRKILLLETRTVARMTKADEVVPGAPEQWIENRRLGFEFGPIATERAEALGLDPGEGIAVLRLSPRSPLGDEEIERGHVIRAVDGERIFSPEGFLEYLETREEAKFATLTTAGPDGKWRKRRVRLHRPDRRVREFSLPLILGFKRAEDESSFFAPLHIFRRNRTGDVVRYRVLWLIVFETGNSDELLEVETY